jgi:hypothetical protein
MTRGTKEKVAGDIILTSMRHDLSYLQEIVAVLDGVSNDGGSSSAQERLPFRRVPEGVIITEVHTEA